ncbi:MAG: N-acetylmuramoyl-L-alanine amidase [Chloroflexi bacterium]|nr:N-acetylmuramoyl-L-alanine amidase [Chloroflexota bacterium]
MAASRLSQSPKPDSPTYLEQTLDFVRAVAPDTWDGEPVNFARSFFSSVRADEAFPNGIPDGGAALVPYFNLEIWGLPTSRPAHDPKNPGFIYQRFQRGIMHYDKSCGCTGGLLLADYVKALMTQQNLPADLAEQAKNSKLIGQFKPGAAQSLARAGDLPGSDLSNSFRRDPVITLDAGHGGTEIGASHTFSDGTVLVEKDLNLKVMLRLRDLLQQAGFQVIPTRTRDAQVNADKKDVTGDGKVTLSDDLQARVDLANSAGSDIFVAVHFNGISDPNSKGTYVFYDPDRPFADKSKSLADLVDRSLSKSLKDTGYPTVDHGPTKDTSVLGGDHYYLLSPNLHIAQLAPPFESVPPRGYGGTERVVSTLTEELVRRGHDVTLFASGDSDTSARLVPIVDEALWHSDPPCNDFAVHQAGIFSAILDDIDAFDIIHSHLDFFGFKLAHAARRPMLSTLHGRLDLPSLVPTYRAFADLPLVSISDAQRRPLAAANWQATVHHGIDLDQFTFNPRSGSYLAFLGRISPDKGLDVAIRVARRAGLRLRVAARPPLAFSEHPDVRRDHEYFEQVIRPMLSEPDVELIGEVGGAEKDAFLGNAAALLFPIRWPEPFGLVMPEALACGTPVLALRDGSVPEVIKDGVTGFVCHFEDELVRAVERISQLDRRRCRAEAELRFSPAAMADAYEDVYAELLEGAASGELAVYA